MCRFSFVYGLKKIVFALVEKSFSCFISSKEIKLIMTLLVKNEEELLEENILYHKAMGVDGFIITDNNSTDRTKEIIEKYVAKGWVLDFIEEKGENYAQKKWVDRMVLLAKRKHKATWVINADADEFWYTPTQNLKKEIENTSANILLCDFLNMYPEEDKPFTQWNKVIYPIDLKEQESYNLSTYSIYNKQRGKVMHATRGYLQISMGNHKVLMFLPRKKKAKISIYHYCLRSKDHFLNKMINGGKQLQQNKKKHGGRHWRYFYQLSLEGKLSDEWARVIGEEHKQRFIDLGYIKEDNTMLNLFNQILIK